MDYVSNRVFDGKRAIPADRADALRKIYRADDQPDSGFASLLFNLLLVPILAVSVYLRRHLS